MPTFQFEQALSVSAETLWAALQDFNNVLPAVAPTFIATVDHVAGTEGEPGSVRLIKFGSVYPNGTYVKEKILSIDPSTFTMNTSEIEGGHLVQGFRKWWPTMTLNPQGSRVVVHWTVSYEGGEDASETIIDQTKDLVQLVFQQLEQHLLASGNNPR